MSFLRQKSGPDGPVEYPFDVHLLGVENPNVSFPTVLSADVLEAFGVFAVEPTEAPRGHVGVNVVTTDPELVNGVWRERWTTVPASQADIAIRVDGLCDDLDNAVAAIYTSVGRYSEEYKLREQQAQEFQAGGYAGEVPRQVAAFANRAGIPAKTAANIILEQAQQLRAALDDLGDLRMRKFEIRAATDPEVAQSVYDDVMGAVTAIGDAIR